MQASLSKSPKGRLTRFIHMGPADHNPQGIGVETGLLLGEEHEQLLEIRKGGRR